MVLRVLTWNLFAGRAVPGAGADLLDAFADALVGWDWDVALLQEVPPWWPDRLAAATGGAARSVRTSRWEGQALRRPLARRWPDAMGSWAGGANVVLARGVALAPGMCTARLRRWPERRMALAARVVGGPLVATVHGTQGPSPRARADAGCTAAHVARWAAGGPVVLAGDLNLRGALSLPGLTWAGAHEVDHVLVGGGVRVREPVRRLDAGRLSDHAPVAIVIESGPGGG